VRFNVLERNWQRALQENRWDRVIILLLVVANVILAYVAHNRSTVVTVAPPEFIQEINVGKQSADLYYRLSFAQWLATTIGNITPANVEFAIKSIEPLLSPRVFRQVSAGMHEQGEKIRLDRIVVRFEPKEVLYDEVSSRFFVLGNSYISGMGGNETRDARVYEIAMDIVNYRPVITHLETYTGQPRVENARRIR
jgi:conjugal transfer pilus assembly protein TraE